MMLANDFDVIVVGAGSSGAVMATRLVEAGKRVLLLEAGQRYHPDDTPPELLSCNPLRAFRLGNPHPYMWPRVSNADPARGYGLGGSSAINSVVAMRGTKEDFDGWQALGCDGWSWNSVLPYFKKLEDDCEYGGTRWHV